VILIDEPKIELYEGDCIEIMKSMPDNSVDCIITDPPYNISKEGNKIQRNYEHYNWDRRSDIGLDFGEWDRCWETEEDFFNFTESWFAECVRVLKESGWIYIFFGKQMTGIFDLLLSKKYGIKARTIYVWVKSNPVPSFRKVNWISGTEHIWVGSKGDSKLKNFLYQKDMNNYFISPNASAYKETEHPTEKPVKLIKHLITVNSNEGDIILDCFAGSGTTGKAAYELNRNCILIEKELEYCEIIKNRMALCEPFLIR
jgi:site-specific DNA-methyltransferase (adenine-specific)/modification methylase